MERRKVVQNMAKQAVKVANISPAKPHKPVPAKATPAPVYQPKKVVVQQPKSKSTNIDSIVYRQNISGSWDE